MPIITQASATSYLIESHVPMQEEAVRAYCQKSLGYGTLTSDHTNPNTWWYTVRRA